MVPWPGSVRRWRWAGPLRPGQQPRSELIGGQNVIDVSKFFWLPLPEGAAFSFLEHHVPPGTSAAGTGSGSGSGNSFEAVQYSLKAPPAGLERFNVLLATLAAAPNGGTLLRADAQLTWYPRRAAPRKPPPPGDPP